MKLSDAQVSALECACLEDCPVLSACWDGGDTIEIPTSMAKRDALMMELIDLSNLEDAFADVLDGQCRTFARRAARSLSALSGKVLKFLK